MKDLTIPVSAMVRVDSEKQGSSSDILAKALPEAVWDTNLVTGITHVNDALLVMFGYTESEVKNNGLWWSSNLDPADRERVERGINEALESDAGVWTDIYRFKCKNGQYKLIADRSTIIRNNEGTAIRLVGTMLDITQSTQREQQLRDALTRYDVLMKATQDAVWDMNLITGETYTNDTLKEIFGYDEEVMNNDLWWNSNLHPDDRERVVAGINAAMDEGKLVWKDEYRFRCKNGTYKIIFDRSTIIRDEKGTPVRLIGAMQDITSERILQQALANRQIVKHQQAAQGLMQVQEQEKQVLGDELHENINQMLATIKLFIDCALDNKNEREKLLKESSGYLNAVIQEIRMLHRDLVPLPLDFYTLTHLLEEEAERMFTMYKINVQVNCTGFNESALDKEIKLMFFRIVQEQLENIRIHSGATVVDIQLVKQNDILMLTVADNGLGVSPDTTYSEGIGFKSIRNKVEVYNGYCKINSEKDKGFVLTVVVPLGSYTEVDTATLQSNV
jgi:two-component system, NarL family, sensor histidine kinase UhpB